MDRFRLSLFNKIMLVFGLAMMGVGIPGAAFYAIYKSHVIYQHCLADWHPDYECDRIR